MSEQSEKVKDQSCIPELFAIDVLIESRDASVIPSHIHSNLREEQDRGNLEIIYKRD